MLVALAPMVLALDFTAAIDNALSWADSNPRIASAILFLLFFLPVMWALSRKLPFFKDAKNAQVFFALVVSVGLAWGADAAQTHLLDGTYIVPEYSWIVLVLALVIGIAIFAYGLMSRGGTTNYQLMAFLIALAVIGAYHILERFLDNLPDSWGDWGSFASILYGIAAVGLVLLSLFFIWNNLISGIRLKPRTPLSDADLEKRRKLYGERLEGKRLKAAEAAADKAREDSKKSREDVRAMENKMTEAQDLLADLTRDVNQEDAKIIKGKWIGIGRRKGRLHEL